MTKVLLLPVRSFSSGSYDTEPAGRLLSKPVLVKIYAQGVIGCAQIRPFSRGLGINVDEAALKKHTLMYENVG